MSNRSKYNERNIQCKSNTEKMVTSSIEKIEDYRSCMYIVNSTRLPACTDEYNVPVMLTKYTIESLARTLMLRQIHKQHSWLLR